MLGFLLSGALFGLTAGLFPGPLLTLVVSQSLTYGFKEGAKVAMAPLITDAPMLLLCLLVISRFAAAQWPLGVLSLAGALFVGYLGLHGFKSTGRIEVRKHAPQSLAKGAIANALNPHPYIFWLTVGAPAVLKGWAAHPAAAVGFLVAFFCCLVGAKLTVAALVGVSKRFVEGKVYISILRTLSAALLLFALLLAKDGLRLLGLWTA